MRMSFKQKVLAVLALTFAVSLTAAVSTVYSASATDCALTMRDCASVRIGNSLKGTGIRFFADINTNILNITDTENHVAEFKNVEEVGMIIVPAYTLENAGNADVFEYLQDTYSAPKEEVSTQFTNAQIQWDKDGYYVAGAIVQIQDANLGLEYQAVPYTWDGTNYTYGNGSVKRSISYVFNAALNDTSEEAIAQKPSVLAKAIEMNGKLDITTELSVADGGDLSSFVAEDYVIDSVTIAGTPVTVTDNVIEENVMDKTLAKKDAQTLAITYVSDEEEQKTLNVNAQVWSLYIDEAKELTDGSMNRASYSVGNAVYGYYKITTDLNMTGAGNVCQGGSTPMVAPTNTNINTNGFQGVFDGDGHTVSNLNLQYRSLFGSIGKDAIVRNVNFENVTYYATKNTAYTHTAILASWVNGGTVENVTVTYTISNNFNTVGSAPTFCGVLFGQVYATGGIWSRVTLKDVTIKALNAESSTNENFAVFGALNTANHTAWGGKYFNTTNVSITGAGIYGDTKDNSICTTGWEGLTFKTGKPVELTGVDTEIGATINFADYVQGKEIQSVTYNGESVGATLTVSDKTQASATPRNYVVTTTDGEKTIVPVTVWSLLINEPAELTNGSMNRASYSVGNAVYGYYKITTDLNMTGAGNVCQGGSTPMVAPTNYSTNTTGFQGVFDGGGHTVSNLNVQYRSLFGAIGKDAIFRNVTFANATYYATKNTAYTHSAILASWVNGGTVENVTVTYTISNNFNTVGDAPTMCGVLFGQTYPTGGTWSRVTLKNVTITALNASTATNTKFAVFGSIKPSQHSAWGGKYFDATNVTVTGAGIYGNLDDNTICKTSGNGITYNAA